MQNVHQLDELDEKILWELCRDARVPNNEIAKRLHVAPSTVLNRIRSLRESGALRSTHAAPNFRAVGLTIQAMIFVRLRAQARAEITTYAAQIMQLPPVLNAFFLGGSEDFLIHVVCTSPEQLRDFVSLQLSRDAAVASTQTNIVFDHLTGADFMDHINGFEDMRTYMTPR